MIFRDSKKQKAFESLLAHKHNIIDSVKYIEIILQENFPEHYDKAYQHWIPQILTSLDNYDKWLSRGNYNMRYTINNILDEINNGKES